MKLSELEVGMIVFSAWESIFKKGVIEVKQEYIQKVSATNVTTGDSMRPHSWNSSFDPQRDHNLDCYHRTPEEAVRWFKKLSAESTKQHIKELEGKIAAAKTRANQIKNFPMKKVVVRGHAPDYEPVDY